ncbi:MAG: SDR family NAD(P)-dependent oxidoreductase [Gloeotrichia echinulata DEX184]|nr:SDR family NAD(P)-dependent oxidoreductase [Gloeotrichia echinulata DEX184]
MNNTEQLFINNQLIFDSDHKAWYWQKNSTYQILELAILSAPLVEDCYVMERDGRLVAYVVPVGKWRLQQLHKHLQSQLPDHLLPSVYVPITTLPMTAKGDVDEETLNQIPVIDSALVQRWEEQLKSKSEIEQVAVVAQSQVENIPPLHLQDLLPAKTMITAKNANQGNISSLDSCLSTAEDIAQTTQRKLAISSGKLVQWEDSVPTTLVEVLQLTAQKLLTKGITYIRADGSEFWQSYRDLLENAQKILTLLRQQGLKPQDKVIFQLSNNCDIISAFWGCILGGFIPVIITPPSSYEDGNKETEKICHIWQFLEQPLILTNAALQEDIKSLAPRLKSQVLKVCVIEEISTCSPDLDYHQSQTDDIAFFSLTSGSTGIPKCIALTHKNLLSRARGTNILCQNSQEDRILNWLPFDHIGSISDWHIRCVDLGCQLVYVQTEYILSRPLNWLDLIDQYRITHSWAPNFAYNLINDALKQESLQQWNLDCVQTFLTAGEAVSNQAVVEFVEHLHSKYSLKKTVLRPAFGMAEMGSGITYFQPTETQPLLFHYIEKNSLKGKLKRGKAHDSNCTTFTDLGEVIPGVSIRIVDAENYILAEDTIGRLQVKGDAVSLGYYKNLAANQEAFLESGWFDTGDLGFISDGHLVITGRAKETIIINGVNYYSHEIEVATEVIAGVEVSYTAACAVRSPSSNTDKLAIFFHTKLTDDGLVNLLKQIRTQVVSQVGINPDYLLPVEKEIIPKTAIGKIQRTQLSKRFEAGEFTPILKQVDVLLGNANTIPAWFYRQIWQPRKPVTFRSVVDTTIVFLDDLGLGEFICQQLQQHQLAYVQVASGSEFQQITSNSYIINPQIAEHYHLLLASLAANHLKIGQILHLWTYDQYLGEVSSLEALQSAQIKGIYSLLFLVQALVKVHNSEKSLQLVFASSHIQSILATDQIAYAKSPVLGLLKTIAQEIPWLNCRHIDLPIDQVEVNSAHLLQELWVYSQEREISYRNQQRFIKRLQTVNFADEPQQDIPFKYQGIYLLSGGLGGVGMQVARYLLQNYQARLILVGRTPLDANLQRLQAYQELHKLGGEVIYATVDICDLDQLQTTVNQVTSQWKKDLDGIIHLAGVFHERLVVEETLESLSAVFRPKILGTWTLHQLLKNNPDSIFISFSSVVSFFGGAAIGAYTSANSFLHSFTHYQKQSSGLQSYCLAWSMWEDIGMSQGNEIKQLLSAKGYYAMSSEEAIASVLISLRHQQADLMIGLDGSNHNIHRYLGEVKSVEKLTAYLKSKNFSVIFGEESLSDDFGTSTSCKYVRLESIPVTKNGEIDFEQLEQQVNNSNQRQRTAPRTETERKIGQSWQEVLGLSSCDIYDNFFELGGNSLLATQLISRLRKDFAIELSLQRLFTAPTIANLAQSIETLIWVNQAWQTSTETEEFEEETL